MKNTDKTSKDVIDYESVVDDPSSSVLLRCKKAYSGECNIRAGQILFYSYKEGDVLPRKAILLKEANWEIHNP